MHDWLHKYQHFDTFSYLDTSEQKQVYQINDFNDEEPLANQKQVDVSFTWGGYAGQERQQWDSKTAKDDCKQE